MKQYTYTVVRVVPSKVGDGKGSYRIHKVQAMSSAEAVKKVMGF